MKALIDNDVLLKGSEYGLLPHFVAAIPGSSGAIGVLGAARYVVSNQIAKRSSAGAQDPAIATFQEFLASNIELEPTPEEQLIASGIESDAQRAGVQLDPGESQLCSVLISRAVPLLVTGDKRAIYAIEILLDIHSLLAAITGKAVCLEQLIHTVLQSLDVGLVRNAICAKPKTDKTLSICFSCSSSTVTNRDSIYVGLTSYIKDLRSKAPRVLLG